VWMKSLEGLIEACVDRVNGIKTLMHACARTRLAELTPGHVMQCTCYAPEGACTLFERCKEREHKLLTNFIPISPLREASAYWFLVSPSARRRRSDRSEEVQYHSK
jgi:hypothetical protein